MRLIWADFWAALSRLTILVKRVDHFLAGPLTFLAAASRMFCTHRVFLVLKVDDITEVGPRTGVDAGGAKDSI